MVVCDIKLKMLNVLPLSDQLRSKKFYGETVSQFSEGWYLIGLFHKAEL